MSVRIASAIAAAEAAPSLYAYPLSSRPWATSRNGVCFGSAVHTVLDSCALSGPVT